MRVGRLNKWVTLSRSPELSGDSDGFFAPLDPEGVWASIEPLSPSENGRSLAHLVTIRFHDQVTMDTRITYGTRQLYVKGFQNVMERDTELRLICEEIVP